MVMMGQMSLVCLDDWDEKSEKKNDQDEFHRMKQEDQKLKK